jgi:acetylornithine/succinyldiaminopimelate/putrescine aminotransferase
VLALDCGPRSIRFRPALNVTEAELTFGLEALEHVMTEEGGRP